MSVTRHSFFSAKRFFLRVVVKLGDFERVVLVDALLSIVVTALTTDAIGTAAEGVFALKVAIGRWPIPVTGEPSPLAGDDSLLTRRVGLLHHYVSCVPVISFRSSCCE